MFNLMGLPDEIIAKVLGNIGYSNICRTRLVNKRLNSIVKRYKLQRLDAYYMSIQRTTKGTYKITFLDLYNEKPEEIYGKSPTSNERSFEKSVLDYSLLEFLDFYLNRVRSVKELSLKKLLLDENLYRCLMKYSSAIRNLKCLLIQECVVSFTPNMLKWLLEPINLDVLDISLSEFDPAILTNEAVGRTRLYVVPSTHGPVPLELPCLNDSYLEMLLMNDLRGVSFFDCKPHFTFNMVKKIMKKHMASPDYFLRWNFGYIDRGGVSFSEISEFLSQFSVDIHETNSENCRNYAVDFPFDEWDNRNFLRHDFNQYISFAIMF